MTHALRAWPPRIEEYPLDEHLKIWAEAVSHPGTPRLLFNEY